MRKWSPAPMVDPLAALMAGPLVLFSLALMLLAAACAGSDDSSGPLNGAGSLQGPTNTTLAPATWEALAVEGDLPAARLGSSLVAAAGSGEFLLFGGWGGGSDYFADIWTLDSAGAAWTLLEPVGTSPPPRAAQATAYDPVTDRLVVFGGYDGQTYFDDTWAYQLATGTWTELRPREARPAGRMGHSMVYEPESETMIMFGGYDAAGQFNDTWEYDPTANTWTDLRPDGTLPAARDSQALAYSPDDKVILLFGGWSETTKFQDTWAYDPQSVAWGQLDAWAPPTPAARALHQFIYDSSIKKFVLLGGGDSNGTFGDAWLFDLARRSWTQLQASGEPPSARAGHTAVYDPRDRSILLFGGSDGMGAYFNDLWRLRR